MKQLKTFLVEKEFDKQLNSTERIKQIAVGFLTLEQAQQFTEKQNKECLQCPRRSALHTKYSIIPNPVTVRMYTADETYHDKTQNRI